MSRSRSRNNSLGSSYPISIGTYSTGISSNYGTSGIGSSIYTNSSSSSSYNPTYSPSYTSSYSSRINPTYTALNSSDLKSGKDYGSKYTSVYSSSPVTSTPTISKKYSGSKTDTDYTGLNKSSWRSRSIDSNGVTSFRDRSLSRDPPEFSYRNNPPISRDLSVGRDYRESSLVSSYNPVNDNIIRPFSANNSSMPLSPTRSRIQNSLKYSTSEAPSSITRSPLVRSNSFHELRDSGSPITRTPRTRHQTLAFGVSEADLQRAKSNMNLSTRSSSVLRCSNGDIRGCTSSTHLGNGYSRSALDLGYGSQPGSRRDSIVSIHTI